MVPLRGVEPRPVRLRVCYATSNTSRAWSHPWESNPDNVLTKDVGFRYIRAAYEPPGRSGPRGHDWLGAFCPSRTGAGDRIRTGTCSLEGFYAAVNTTPAMPVFTRAGHCAPLREDHGILLCEWWGVVDLNHDGMVTNRRVTAGCLTRLRLTPHGAVDGSRTRS